ncbi:hypothetical protein TeGR_g14464 [Tetraparma gracilis]|uniref:FERM domain-containing protein n=1 Tax=Tetraparma gracilis TaxID=2962635 RepID=A0ABQ6N1J4_9STRA|nr:hypothetical protein TeGR_g14464 [Tetraparma gracilis]
MSTPTSPASSADSDFYSDEERPQSQQQPKIIYEEPFDSDEACSDAASEHSAEPDLDEGVPLHTMLATPRLPPTPYDPPDYTPILDKNALLAAYRRIRNALLVERERHQETRDEIVVVLDKIKLCREFGAEKMKKCTEVRERQDEIIKDWKQLIVKNDKKEKEMHKDIGELSTELRNLRQNLELEVALKANEERNVDKVEDDIVVKEMEGGVLIAEVGMKNMENAKLHEAKDSMEKALLSTNEFTEDGEERLRLVGEELGLTEVDVFMLQRDVRKAEEEAKKWRHR